MPSSVFNKESPSSWPLFTTVDAVRTQFSKDTAIMIAIGGWGDTSGFSEAAASDASRKRFAQNVKAMVDYTGADGLFNTTLYSLHCLLYLGVDIDWEYPGQVPFITCLPGCILTK